jgi:phosphopantothenoylcysteine decarboxylase/phosphopantothenate--cysteine ligase
MKILVGVTGGIAAYKAVELVRALQRAGAEVQVVMTPDAERFVTPLTFAAISGRQVLTSLWSPVQSAVTSSTADPFAIEHIAVAQSCDAFVIAPATANTLAKLAHGLADDLLTTMALATSAPILVAPAMNVVMWKNPATQANVRLLRERGVEVIEPEAGELACGMVGAGRLAEVDAIAARVLAAVAGSQSDLPADVSTELAGITAIVTAGGTREPIDPVRYIGNRSSGRMGLALAQALLRRGAEVILVMTTGPCALACEQVLVATADEMQQAVARHLARAQMIFMAAAVADYRVAEPALQKLKKQSRSTLELVPTVDILQWVGEHKRPDLLVIGFAAETEHLLEEGRRKLLTKRADAILANDVSSPEQGIGSDWNAGALITPEATYPMERMRKDAMAERLLDWASAELHRRMRALIGTERAG